MTLPTELTTQETKQLIHDVKVARVLNKLRDFNYGYHHEKECGEECTCGLSDILKELDELEKE